MIAVSPTRVLLAVSAAGGLALLLLAVAVLPALPFAARAVILAFGLGALLLALALWRARRGALVLDLRGIADETGARIATWPEIARAHQSPFGLRPSGGIGLQLRSAAVPGWRPGLWWRWGRRAGLGGMLGRAGARELAAAILWQMDQHRQPG
jgi:hypothetical protein